MPNLQIGRQFTKKKIEIRIQKSEKKIKIMKLKFIYLLTILSFFLSCKNENSQKEKESQLKEKELLLKENENPKEKSERKSATEIIEVSNVENVIGNWFIPHNATVNIKFTRDGRFVFNDYNSQTEQEEVLTGEFKVKSGVITLLYDDRARQKFKIKKGTNGDTNYYITKGNDYYFVKGEN